jgi:UDP-glucose 4-epimerase
VFTSGSNSSGGGRVVAINRAVTPAQRVLVLGAGFIGAHVVRVLVQAGHQVDVITRSAPQPELAPYLQGANVVLGDVSSMAVVAGLLSEVDHVVYAVGSSSPIESDLDPAADVTAVVPPVVRLLELLRLRPSVGLTFLSSGGALYGNVASTPVDEETPPAPISSYGILKLTAEKYLQMYADLYGIPITILRVANAYGPGQPWAKGQGIVARLMRCVLTGEPFQVFGSGQNVRDYVYIDDVAQVVAGLLESHDGHRVFNVGSGKGHTILDLIEMVQRETGRTINVEFKNARYFDVRSIVLDIRLLSQALPFAPLDVPAGLQRTWFSIAQLDSEHLPALTPPQSPVAAP